MVNSELLLSSMGQRKEHFQQTTEQVYNFIRDYIQEYGVSPSQRQIAEGCYLSRGGLIRYLDRLEAQQRILRDTGLARSIRLVREE